jgi:hypothetical protein
MALLIPISLMETTYLGSNRMITGDHDDFDSSRSTLGDGIRDSSPGRVNHRHKAHESHSGQGEVGLVAVKFEAQGEFIGRQEKVAESKYSLSQTSQLVVSIVERLTHLFIQNLWGKTKG